MPANANIKPHQTTVNDAEIAKFAAMADEWWDLHGKFKPLHQMNPLRIAYIRDRASGIGGRGLQDLRVLDIGCGGGLLAEPLCRLGAKVTAIDAGERNVQVAKFHAEKEGLAIDYRFATAEELAAAGEQFDCVTALEIIEHVDHVPQFLEACAALVKPGGTLFISTLNRTAKAFGMAILGAEYLLRLLPKGTHEWRKFITPAELVLAAAKQGLVLQELKGFSYRPLSQQWRLSDDLSVNYIAAFRR